MKPTALLAILFLICAGCSGGGDSAVVGKWKGQAKTSEAQKDNPMAKMLEGVASMMSMDIDFKDDHTFKMLLVIFPIEGTWSRSGNEVTLTPVKVMGMAPGEFKAEQAKMSKTTTPPSQDLGKPMVLIIQADGTMTMEDPEHKNDSNGILVFTRQNS